MKHVEYWIANDGTQFTDEIDCERHELESELANTSLCAFFKDGTRCASPLLLTEFIHNKCDAVYVPDDKALSSLKRIQDFTGFYCGIDECGKWIYDPHDYWTKISSK